MSKPSGEVPALPFAALVGILLFAAPIVRLLSRGLFAWPRGPRLCGSIDAAGILANTMFPIYLDFPDSGDPWTPNFAIIPFNDYEISDACKNVGVFVPLGILIAMFLARPAWGGVLLIASTISLAIELM